MKNAIHRDMRKIERRESRLWFLALGLLILFGAVIAGRYVLAFLSEAGSDSGQSQAPAYRVGWGVILPDCSVLPLY